MKFSIQALKLLLFAPFLIVVALALNPAEVANKKRDEMYLATARHFQNSAQKYFTKQNTTASYGFVSVDKLGFEALDLDPNDKFIAENINNFYVGREKRSTATAYVCYVPMARFNRDANCNDKTVYILNSTEGTRSVVDCTIGSNWQTGDRPWVVCLPN